MIQEIEHIDWLGRAITVLQMNDQRWYGWDGGLDAGRILVSCTTVINAIYGKPFPKEAAHHAEHARERGNEWHHAVKLLYGGVKGMTLDWRTLDPEVLPRVEHVQLWQQIEKWRPKYIERAFKSDRYLFACTPDQVGTFEGDDKIHVLDLKPAKAPTVGIQTAAQALAVKESLGLDYAPKRIALHVSERDCVPVELDKPKTDRDAFLACLHAFNYGNQRRLFHGG